MAVRITITSLENDNETYVFQGVSHLEAVLALLKGIPDIVGDCDIEDLLGELLCTVGEAIAQGSSKSWDFSSPESAYSVEVDEIEDEPAPKIVPTITKLDRENVFGSCKVTATYSDGATRHLFDYYLDEIGFFDSELIGLTEVEAHNLRRSKDVAYLRS